MSNTIKKRLELLEKQQPVTGYTFQEFNKIPFTAEVQARFRALYEPIPKGGKS